MTITHTQNIQKSSFIQSLAKLFSTSLVFRYIWGKWELRFWLKGLVHTNMTIDWPLLSLKRPQTFIRFFLHKDYTQEKIFWGKLETVEGKARQCCSFLQNISISHEQEAPGGLKRVNGDAGCRDPRVCGNCALNNILRVCFYSSKVHSGTIFLRAVNR